MERNDWKGNALSQKVLDRPYSQRLIVVTILIITAVALSASSVFYFFTNRELGETYGQKLMMLPLYRSEIIKQSVFIFMGFAFIACFVMLVFIIFHTHKIVGPLCRIRMIAKELAAGNFAVLVRLRQTDAIHPLEESLKRFAGVTGERYSLINAGVLRMSELTREMRDILVKGDSRGATDAREKIADEAKKLEKILAGIRL